MVERVRTVIELVGLLLLVLAGAVSIATVAGLGAALAVGGAGLIALSWLLGHRAGAASRQEEVS